MEIEERRLGRRLTKPVLVTLFVVGSMVLPTWLWIERGRVLPLSVLLDPPQYEVRAGRQLPLRLRLEPAAAREQVVLEWQGPGLSRTDDPGRAVWTAPGRPGSYTVSVTARRSGTKVKDSVTFQVTRDAPLRLARPPSGPPPPADLPRCKERARRGASPGVRAERAGQTLRAPKVLVHGIPCAGGTVVLELAQTDGISGVWHMIEGQAPRHGAWAELVLPSKGTLPPVATLALAREPDTARDCGWTLSTRLDGKGCVAGPGSRPVFADFAWQLVGPGHYRFAAKPSRTPGVRFARYSWDFGDGTTRKTREPQLKYRYQPPLKRWHLVRLEVEGSDGSRATTVRLAVDRTVE